LEACKVPKAAHPTAQRDIFMLQTAAAHARLAFLGIIVVENAKHLCPAQLGHI